MTAPRDGDVGAPARWRPVLFSFLEILPLSVFVVFARRAIPGEIDTWRQGFVVAGTVAALMFVVRRVLKTRFTPIVLGANFYLAAGAVAFIVNAAWVLAIYRSLRESAMFVAILLTGAVLAACAPNGFADAPNPDRRRIRLGSTILLIATLGAIGVSIVFRGRVGFGGIMPFVALMIIQKSTSAWQRR
ncbi:MAG: hypothetical protein CMJ18_26700 [Phycisphaeraceae bacterium]|nr:hypothetical protein [Phycisphaeraceae bacterium]